MRCVGVIPVRFSSRRLPGKPLTLIGGKPLIQHVWERANAAERLDSLIVAVDDKRVYEAVKGFGGMPVMTSTEHPSGSDRIAEAVRDEEAEVIVNVQGDEPFISPSLIDELTGVFEDPAVLMATPVRKAEPDEDLSDPNSVKVVVDSDWNALYFSRTPIPFKRSNGEAKGGESNPDVWIHIGLYAYRREFLFEFTRLPVSSLEAAEKLEQLRAIENGFPIRVMPTDYRSMPVDTPEDLKKAERIMAPKTAQAG